MSTKLENKDLTSNDAKPMLGEVKEVEIHHTSGNTILTSFTIHKKTMSEIKINDFWGWLNRYIPNNQALKLMEIVDCDYKRIMIRKYSKL